jgi:hypothetical protein
MDVGLIVVAVVVPFVLIFFNLVVMAHYIDPQAASGHFIAKLVIVSGSGVARGLQTPQSRGSCSWTRGAANVLFAPRSSAVPRPAPAAARTPRVSAPACRVL